MRFSVLGVTAAGAVVVALASQAYAADLPARAPYKAPLYSPAPAFSWSGFYAGVNAGWGWTSGDGTVTLGGASAPYSGSGNGFLGGGQIGYNLQSGNLVYGVEADFQGSSGRGDINTIVGGTPIIASAKVPWFGTVRGRLGYAFDRSLLYVTGGGLYGKSTLDGTIGGAAFSSSATYWTWTVGGGYEQMLWDHWSGKLEYLYAGSPNNAPTAPGTTVSGSGHTHIVRVGLNYHF